MRRHGVIPLSLIEIKDLAFHYSPKRPILHDIQFNVEKGDWIAVLGHNGSGKSTLAKLIMGLLQPISGTVSVFDQIVTPENVYDIRKHIGIVFQNPDNQFVGTTVRDDIAFGMENLCFPRETMKERIDFYAAKVGLSGLLDKEPSALSGGQKQRVAIAGILAMKTDIIVFDEATSMLDPLSRAELIQYIRTLNQEGLTILMITHDIEEALYANRIVILNHGTIAEDGTPEKLFRRPSAFSGTGLELPVSLRLYYALSAKGGMTPKLEEFLWASSSKR